MAPFYGWGSTASRLEPLWGGSLLFTTKFPPTLEGWKAELTLEPPSGFEHGINRINKHKTKDYQSPQYSVLTAVH